MQKRTIMTTGIVLFGLAMFFFFQPHACACDDFDFMLARGLDQHVAEVEQPIPTPTSPARRALVGKVGATKPRNWLDVDGAAFERVRGISHIVDARMRYDTPWER